MLEHISWDLSDKFYDMHSGSERANAIFEVRLSLSILVRRHKPVLIFLFVYLGHFNTEKSDCPKLQMLKF